MNFFQKKVGFSEKKLDNFVSCGLLASFAKSISKANQPGQ
jgi:hypothetical protein